MKRFLTWGIPTLAVAGLIFWRFTIQHQQQAQTGKLTGKGSVSVQVATAISRSITQTIQSVGDIESPYKVEVSPKTAGRITYLEAREGDVVTPGEILVKVDPSDLQGALLQQQASFAETQARYTQAKLTQNSTNVGIRSQIQEQLAALNTAKANLSLAQQNYNSEVAGAQALVTGAQSGINNAQAALDKENATLRNVQVKYDRTVSLFKQNFIASQDVDDAKTALDVEKGSVEVATAQLHAAQSQLKVEQTNLAITQRKGKSDIAAAVAAEASAEAAVRIAQANTSASPAYQENLDALQNEISAAADQVSQAQSRISDTIVRATFQGTVTARKADPGDLATPGTPVLEVQYLDWLYVNSTLPIDSSPQVHAGQIATVTIDGLPGRTFSGPITNVNPAADPLSRQFGIKVRLNNGNHLVKPGMYGKVTIVTSEVEAKAVVPKEAITTDVNGVSTVTVIDSSDVAHVKTVKLGVSDDQGVQIVSGVSPGDRVATLTYNSLKEGQKVTISPTSSGSMTPPTVSVTSKRSAPKKP